MRSPRPSRLLAVAALCGMLAAAAWPSVEHLPNHGGGLTDHTITVLNYDYHDYGTVYAPYALDMDYTTPDDNMEVVVNHPGMDDGPKNAPKTMGNKDITLKYTMDTTGVDVSVDLRVTGGAVKKQDPRVGMTFIAGGMGPLMLEFKDLPPGVIPDGAEPAEPAAKPGDPIPAGVHFAAFPPSDKIILGSQARVWVQGKFKKGPLKPEYDLPAVLFWLPKGKVFYPCWVLTLPEKLAAGPLKADGETPLTVMRPVLLDGKGKVRHIMTHRHWK